MKNIIKRILAICCGLILISCNSGSGSSSSHTPGSLIALGTVAAGNIPFGISISPDGKNLYVANGASGTVSQYSRNSSTGLLTAIGTETPVQTGLAPQQIIVSPDGKNVYISNFNSNTVSQYSRNSSTGLLTAIGPISTGTRPVGISISPDGTNVYIANYGDSSISQYSRSSSTGLLTAIGPISTGYAGAGPIGISISPDGSYVYVTDTSVALISQYRRGADGKLEFGIPPNYLLVRTGNNPAGIIVSPDGLNAYAANNGSNTVSQYDRITYNFGQLTILTQNGVAANPIGAGSKPFGISITPDGNNVYVANQGSNTISQYSRNVAIPAVFGLLTALTPATVAAGSQPSQIAISPDSLYVYVTNSSSNTVSQYRR